MKNNLRLLIMIAAFGVALSCAANDLAQIKVGGYKKVSKIDAGVVAAAEFAFNTQSEKDESLIAFNSVETAERQTVAGTNYKLCIEVETDAVDENDQTTRFIETVVFYSLKREYQLKSWTEVKQCAEEERKNK